MRLGTGTGTGIQLHRSHLGQDGSSSFGSMPPMALIWKVQMQFHVKTAQPCLSAPPVLSSVETIAWRW